MPAILIYLLKVNIALLLFCLCYYAILRRLTFYTLNRVYLITAIIFSSVYPQIDFTKMFERSEKLVQPIQVVVINFNMRAANFAKPVTQTNYWEWLVIIFWTGVIIMALRLAMQFWSLLRIYRRSKPAQIYDHNVRVISEQANPFSFWQSIYINPHHHGADELRSIIAHEQVHVSQWHTLDILLAEISLVFYWFNPGVWLMKKAVSENLEFITDQKILQQGVDAKSYQYSLLYASFNTSPNAVVNHFNISTIKKRIMMMNSKRSSVFSLTRYGLVAPAIVLLVLIFGTTKAELLKEGIKSAKAATHKVIEMASITIKEKDDIKKQSKPAANPSKEILKANQVELKNQLDSTVKVQNISFTNDTPKYKMSTTVHFTGPDSAYYIINGKPLNSLLNSNINPNDIVSMHLVGPPSSTKLFGGKAKNGAVFIITKDGENSDLTKELLQKVLAIKKTGPSKETGIITVNPPKGSLNSITITNPVDSSFKNIKGAVTSVTITGSSSANTGPASKRVTGVRLNGQTYSDSTKEVTVVGYGTRNALGITTTKPVKNVRINGHNLGDSALKEITVMGYGTATKSGNNVLTLKTAQKSPLYVVNGVPAEGDVLKRLDPNTLEKVDILKDSSAVALWGPKAKDGVIIITTKQGTKPKKKD